MKNNFELAKIFTGGYFISLFGILGLFFYWQYSTIKEFHNIELKNYFIQTNKIVNVLIEKEKSDIKEIVLSNIRHYSNKNKEEKISIDNLDFIFSTENGNVVHLDGYNLFVDVNKLANRLVSEFLNKNISKNIVTIKVDEKIIYAVVHKEKIIDETFGRVVGALWGVTILNENVSLLKEFKINSGVENLAIVGLDNYIVASTLEVEKMNLLMNQNIDDNLFMSKDSKVLVNKQNLYNDENLKAVLIVDNKQYSNIFEKFKNKAILAVLLLALFGILLYLIIKIRFINKLSNLKLFIQNTLQKKDTVYEPSSIMELDTIASEFKDLFLDFQKYQENLEETVQTKTDENIKQLEILQQQSKLAQMGEMIGAIAHQWRQPLNVISTGIQNLKYDYNDGNLNDEEFVKNFISENKKTINFMSKTIDDFRSFFRIDKEKIDFAVLETTQSVLDMQSSQLRSHDIKISLTGEEFHYYGLQSEFQQVILNIVNNAKDALLDNNVKNPMISISLMGKKIMIEDNAGGIPDEIMNRVFDPYFTTKEQGKGTGIGLYISKLIIENNMESSLEVKNTKNGAQFIIVLQDAN